MIPTRRIALLLDRGLSVVREVMQGVRIYAANQPSWTLRDCPPWPHLAAHVRDWKPHGIIAGLTLPRMAEELARLGRPLVDIANTLPGLKVPIVDVDHTVVGRLAAEYFLERKFTHFGFFGSESAAYSITQESSFRKYLAESGYEVSSCFGEFLSDLTTPRLWKKLAQKTHHWLRRLGKPAAIFCCDDAPARYLADLCIQMGLRVPDDVALLGLGNDEMECELSQPALSSIMIPAKRIGYEAAALLDRLMSGETWSRKPLFLPPLHVVTRHSTDILAMEDEMVLAALQYVRRHAWEPMSVANVAQNLAVGRRRLELRFRQVLGRSVLDEIHRVRVDRAKVLLTDTDMPITAIAANSGFSSIRRLDVVFNRVTGISPSAYRHSMKPPYEIPLLPTTERLKNNAPRGKELSS
jgi:LacI family transcriptional regulator